MSTEEIVIQVQTRSETGKGVSRRLRSAGCVPAIIYGHGKQAASLSVEETEITPFLHHSGLVKLKVDGKGRAKTAVIKDYQINAIRGDLVHIDFLEVRADEVITATIAVIAHGTPAGTSQGGTLDQVLHSIEIRAAANKLIESFEVDVSGLEVGDSITLGDLDTPDGVEIQGDPEQIVFNCNVPRIHEEEAEEEGEEEGEGVQGGEEAEEEAAQETAE